MNPLITRDERETAVDLAADRLSFLVLAYGVLAVAAVRSFGGQQTWDLLGLVVVAGAAGLIYRLVKGAVTRSWMIVATATAVAAAIIGAIILGGLAR